MTDGSLEALRRAAAHVFVDNVATPSLSDDDTHHLGRVLRLRDGQIVTCCDGRGAWRACTWTDGGLEVSGDIVAEVAPTPALCVVVTPVKGDRTDDAVQRLVEIGIDRILVLAPVERSVVRWDDHRAASHLERMRRIVRAAAMQSRRLHLPSIEGPVAFDEVVATDGVAVAEPSGGAPWSEVTSVVVGPEGGFTSDEVALARRSVSLGGSILRAETAAMVAGARLVAHWRP